MKEHELFAALGDETRLKIIRSVDIGSKNVTQISKDINLSVVNTSHHLKILRQAGVVTDSKQGRFVNYTLNSKLFRALSNGFSFVLDSCAIDFSREKK